MPDPSPRAVALALRALADEIEDGRLRLIEWSDHEAYASWSGSLVPVGVREVTVRVAGAEEKE